MKHRNKFAVWIVFLWAVSLPIYPASAAACTVSTSTFTGDGVNGISGAQYTLLEFKNTGTCEWTAPRNLNVDVLIVGGGGGAGFGSNGGGGGAGQVITNNSALSITSGDVISISVGGGGNGGWSASSSSWNFGANGNSSAFGSYATAIGGGGGGGNNGSAGKSGGSGGGGSGTVAASQSLSGGSGNTTTNSGWTARGSTGGTGAGNYGSGGGGASANGANGISGSGAGAGGAGVTIFGKKVGGGGGGWGNSNTAGGEFGGGNGVLTNYVASNACSPICQGTANTGGGGGGGATGGSGIVALRYLTDTTAPTITGPSSATGATSSISIGENSTAVHSFTANETVTWSKSGTDGSFFSITSGGVLTITARDFESAADNGANNTYIVAVTATDSASNATTQTLTVTITNVNEAPSITIASSAATHTITQAENISSVLTYTGSDVDSGTTLTWSLSGTDAADMTIGSATGVLSFASNPDFEDAKDSDTNNTYIFVVTLSDGTLTDTQTVTLTITNANESASLGTPSLSATPLKGVQLTITVTSTVAGKVRFSVNGKRISNCLARSTTGSYTGGFTATCSWKPTVMNRQILTARVTPTDNTFSATTSAPLSLLVIKRVGVR